MTDTHEDDEMSHDDYRKQIVTQQATYWFLRFMDEPVMPLRDRKRFVKWLKLSPENISAILRVRAIDGRLKRRKLLDCVGGLLQSNVIEADFDTGLGQYDYQPSEYVSDKVPRRRNVAGKASWKHKVSTKWRAVAAVAAFAVGVPFAYHAFNATPSGVVETRAAQLRSMTLDDGSTVVLDARTRIKVEYTDERRIVHLYNGSAVFDVMKDRRRPFTVITDEVEVTAVGTRFGVDIDHGVRTTVGEGVVEVKPRDGRAGSSVLLYAGEQLHVRSVGTSMLSVADIVEVDAKRELAWVSGRLELRDTTLGEIARQFNRRHDVQADIRDLELANRRIDLALIQIDDVEAFIEVMESQGVTVLRVGSTLILRPKKPAGKRK